MDNSFDKLNNEFAEKKSGGVKYAIYVALTFIFDAIGIGFGVYALSHNHYISLLTLLFGLFGTQAIFKAKGGGSWNKVTKVGLIISLVVVVLACIVLYIVPMFTD